MKKKVISVIISLIMLFTMAFSFAACTGDNELQAQIDDLKNQVEQLEEQIEQLEEQIGQLEEQIKQLEEETAITGKSLTLAEAYNADLLCKEDIMHISYFLSGSVIEGEMWDGSDWREVNFVPTKETPVVDENTENYIKTTYYNFNKEIFELNNANINDITVMDYLGEYNGCKVAVIRLSFCDRDTSTAPYKYFVAGLVLSVSIYESMEITVIV